MKKATIISATFLVVFGLTLGAVLSLNQDANAVSLCSWRCTFKTTWTTLTGPECPGICQPDMIYKITRRSTCAGGPLNCPFVNEVIGCWNGTDPIGCLIL
jgi:hypothetical protein